MQDKLKHHTISFKNAASGILAAFGSQPNYQIHLFLSLISILGGLYFQIVYPEWLVILTLITVGLVIETVNTAIETATDAISGEWRPDIKLAKDLSAGAMLIFAIGAFVIAGVIFLPKIFSF